MGIIETMKLRWKAHQESERLAEEKKVMAGFYLADVAVHEYGRETENCICIMHEGIALQRYYGKDDHRRMMEDLTRYRRVAADELRARRANR